MNVSGLNSFYNLGLGLEENIGKHLALNFFNTSLGYIKNIWDWNVNIGAGYFVSLNTSQTLRLTGSLNIGFESLTYGLGSDYDVTQLGFIVNGINVGSTITNLKYVNDIWSLSPGLQLLYRRRSIDLFAGVYYNYVFSYYEKVNFFRASEPVSAVIFYPPYGTNNNISKDVVNLGKYIIQIGIVREFGI